MTIGSKSLVETKELHNITDAEQSYLRANGEVIQDKSNHICIHERTIDGMIIQD